MRTASSLSPSPITLELRPHLVGGMKRGWAVSSEKDKTTSPPHPRRCRERSHGEGQEVSAALRAMTSMASFVAALVERIHPLVYSLAT